MWWTGILVVLTLPGAALCCYNAQDLTCHVEKCSYVLGNYMCPEESLCSWQPSGGWNVTWVSNTNAVAVWSVEDGVDTDTPGHLTSPVTCASRRQDSCLAFKYLFSHHQVIDLNVYLKNATDGVSTLVWSASTNQHTLGLNQARLPVARSDHDFVVIIEAKLRLEAESGRGGGEGEGAATEAEQTDTMVLLDDTDFTYGACAVQPVSAAVAGKPTVGPGLGATTRRTATRGPDPGYVVEQGVTLSPVRDNGDNSAVTTAPALVSLAVMVISAWLVSQ